MAYSHDRVCFQTDTSVCVQRTCVCIYLNLLWLLNESGFAPVKFEKSQKQNFLIFTVLKYFLDKGIVLIKTKRRSEPKPQSEKS